MEYQGKLHKGNIFLARKILFSDIPDGSRKRYLLGCIKRYIFLSYGPFIYSVVYKNQILHHPKRHKMSENSVIKD
jgi:hypothetical protein